MKLCLSASKDSFQYFFSDLSLTIWDRAGEEQASYLKRHWDSWRASTSLKPLKACTIFP